MRAHTHTYTIPCQADRIRSQIRVRCEADGHTVWRAARACPACAARQDAHREAVMAYRSRWRAMTLGERWADTPPPPGIFVPGCPGCYLGLIPEPFEAGCCCYRRRPPCDTCARQEDRTLIHVCEYTTPAEARRERVLAAGTAAGTAALPEALREWTDGLDTGAR